MQPAARSGPAVEPGDAGWETLVQEFPEHPGVRSVVVLDVERITTSCGYGVPLFDYRGQRTQLPAWVERKGHAGIQRYQAEKNRQSIDGLPGLRRGPEG